MSQKDMPGGASQKYASPTRNATYTAEATCRRLGLDGSDAAFFMTVFSYVREEELAGHDTDALWWQYRTDRSADLATAAYIEGIASARRTRAARAAWGAR